MLIPLTRGQFAIIDDSIAHIVMCRKWCCIATVAGKYYAGSRINVDGVQKTQYLHQFIMGKRDGFFIDHINGNGLDNRSENLRFVTPRQNNLNRAVSRHSKSGVLGVSWDKSNKRWGAYIVVDRKLRRLGSFRNIEDATAARLSAEAEFYGEYARVK